MKFTEYIAKEAFKPRFKQKSCLGEFPGNNRGKWREAEFEFINACARALIILQDFRGKREYH